MAFPNPVEFESLSREVRSLDEQISDLQRRRQAIISGVKKYSQEIECPGLAEEDRRNINTCIAIALQRRTNVVHFALPDRGMEYLNVVTNVIQLAGWTPVNCLPSDDGSRYCFTIEAQV